MKQSILDRFMSRKGLYVGFWVVAIVVVTALIVFTANLAKEVPPIPKEVKSASGEVLYTYDDVVHGKALFQEFDLMDYGTFLGMGAYLGPDFPTEFFHKRVEFLYNYYAQELFSKPRSELTEVELGEVKERVKQDLREQTHLSKDSVVYTEASAEAFKKNRDYLVNFLVNGDRSRAYPGKYITPEEAKKIAAFVDWGQLVQTTIRPGTNRTWSNDWPNEPLVDQRSSWTNHFYSLWEFLLLWTFTIIVIFLAYEYLLKKDEPLEPPLQITKLYPSQNKLLKYVPIVALLFFAQLILGGYLAHLYSDPVNDFVIPQSLLPFNAARPIHINLAILWIAIGWLVGGLLIAPLVAGEDLKYPWLVDVLWLALLVVGIGGIAGIYLGATGHLRHLWFWLGNEGREFLNLGRIWDIALVLGLVLWFLLVFSLVRKARENSVMLGVIIWSAFGIATLYIAGMIPLTKIMPNFTVGDYYRWWVVHLWVELTFELFAAGVLAYLSVALGLVSRKTAERIMLFEIFLIMMTGVLGVGHHYWWQGLDQYWIAVGGIFSALEPLPLVLMMIEAWKNQREKVASKEGFAFTVPFMWLAGSAFLNWLGAGFFGMVINTPTIDYYAHGTYLIMPHAHVALLGAFGYISLAFLYLVARSNSLAKGLSWSDTLSKWGFWLLTIGVVLFAIPTAVIGFHQAKVSHDIGYYFARTRDALKPVMWWAKIRIIPDGLMILGGALILWDLVKKIYFTRRTNQIG